MANKILSAARPTVVGLDPAGIPESVSEALHQPIYCDVVVSERDFPIVEFRN